MIDLSPQAFRVFFLNHYAEFLSFSDLLLRDKRSAKNVTVAAFFLLWAKHDDFDNERNVKAFLYTTIRDNCLNYLRYLQEHPYTPEYTAETRFAGSLPAGILQELLVFSEQAGVSGV